MGLLLALVFFSYVKIHLKYYRVEEDDTVSLEFFLWGIINYKVEVPVIILQQKFSGISLTTRTELETGGEDSKELMGRHGKFSIESIEDAICKFREWWPFLESIMEDFDYFLRHLILKRFDWRIRFGTPDAAATGMLSGVAWSIMGMITSAFYKRLGPKWNQPVLKVEPDFRKQGFSTALDCIFKIRVGNIMVTGIKILKKKANRRGVNKLGRASHRRPNENCHGEY